MLIKFNWLSTQPRHIQPLGQSHCEMPASSNRIRIAHVIGLAAIVALFIGDPLWPVNPGPSISISHDIVPIIGLILMAIAMGFQKDYTDSQKVFAWILIFSLAILWGLSFKNDLATIYRNHGIHGEIKY